VDALSLQTFKMRQNLRCHILSTSRRTACANIDGVLNPPNGIM